MKEKRVSLWIALIFLAGVFYLFAVKGMKFYLVPSKSMVPTLEQSDYIAGFKINRSGIKRGEVIVFTSGHKEDFYVKRIIGLPGETLAIADGFVYINGRKLDEPYVKSRGADNFGPITIPDGYVFVMGDNRTDSFDSRQFGPIPERLLETKVAFIYNPISRIGCVH
jgi:signal peptidase I